MYLLSGFLPILKPYSLHLLPVVWKISLPGRFNMFTWTLAFELVYDIKLTSQVQLQYFQQNGRAVGSDVTPAQFLTRPWAYDRPKRSRHELWFSRRLIVSFFTGWWWSHMMGIENGTEQDEEREGWWDHESGWAEAVGKRNVNIYRASWEASLSLCLSLALPLKLARDEGEMDERERKLPFPFDRWCVVMYVRTYGAA